MTVSYIVATTGRPTLQRALDSIELWTGDELIVVGEMGHARDARVRWLPSPARGDWGHSERNYAMPFAKGDYLAHLDDDDIYLPGARAMMDKAIHATPGRPVVFKIQWSDGHTLWKDRQIKFGNVGTPMVVMPNVRHKLGKWAPFYGGDHAFLKTCRWKSADYAWRTEVLAHIRP
jgi:hypothetical protein